MSSRKNKQKNVAKIFANGENSRYMIMKIKFVTYCMLLSLKRITLENI